MTNEEAVRALTFHLKECGALMPFYWLQKNGKGSHFMEAYEMAIKALKEKKNEI